MLQGGVRIVQVGEVTIIHQDIHCREETQVAHPGENVAEQTVPVRLANLPTSFI